MHGEVKELLPNDVPTPLVNYIRLTHYVDANQLHDKLSSLYVTGIPCLVNKTPVDWYPKKQSTVETATYGSEFFSARTCVEQIIDFRNTLQ